MILLTSSTAEMETKWVLPNPTYLPPREQPPFDMWSVPVLLATVDRLGQPKLEVGNVRYAPMIDGHGRPGTRVGDATGYGGNLAIAWALLPEYPMHLFTEHERTSKKTL